jgi:hypothetical protein
VPGHCVQQWRVRSEPWIIPFPPLLIKRFPQESRFLRLRPEPGAGAADCHTCVIHMSSPRAISGPLFIYCNENGGFPCV